jgi:hypothetical protein
MSRAITVLPAESGDRFSDVEEAGILHAVNVDGNNEEMETGSWQGLQVDRQLGL